jgi:hypothetical protein
MSTFINFTQRLPVPGVSKTAAAFNWQPTSISNQFLRHAWSLNVTLLLQLLRRRQNLQLHKHRQVSLGLRFLLGTFKDAFRCIPLAATATAQPHCLYLDTFGCAIRPLKSKGNTARTNMIRMRYEPMIPVLERPLGFAATGTVFGAQVSNFNHKNCT